MKEKIYFSNIGPYYQQIKYVIEKITNLEIITPPADIKENISLGSMYSPKNICQLFKYELGNYIYAIRKEASILISFTSECLSKYYGELHEAILEEMGYHVKLIKITTIKELYIFAKDINYKLNPIKFVYYLLQGIIMVIFINNLNKYYYENYAISENKEKFKILKKQVNKYYSKSNLSIFKIVKNYYKFRSKYHKLNNLCACKPLKILLIATPSLLINDYNIEEILLKNNIIIYHHKLYHINNEAINKVIKYCKKNIDGIIFLQSNNCIFELNTIPIIKRISTDYNIQALFLDLDIDIGIYEIDNKISIFLTTLATNKQQKQIKSP